MQESIALEISNSKTKNGISKCGARDLESLYTRPTTANSSATSTSNGAAASATDGAESGSGAGGGGGARGGKKPKGRTGWPQHVWAQELKPEQTEVCDEP